MVRPGEVQRYMVGLRRLVAGDQGGFSDLDITADGFWRSFAAIPYALPAFLVSWTQYRLSYIQSAEGEFHSGLGFYLTVAFVDLMIWLIPIVVVAMIAAPLGLSAFYARWVIATNWLSVPLAYIMALPVALMLLVPSLEPVAIALSLAAFALALVAYYRVSRLALGGERAVAVAITISLVVLSFAMTGVLENLIGL